MREIKKMSFYEAISHRSTVKPSVSGGDSPCKFRPNSEAVNDRAKLLMHRLIARKISMQPMALEDVKKSLEVTSERECGYVREWRSLLSEDVGKICVRLGERSEEMYRLRLSSPLMSIVDFSDPSLRRRLYQKARQGVQGPPYLTTEKYFSIGCV